MINLASDAFSLCIFVKELFLSFEETNDIPEVISDPKKLGIFGYLNFFSVQISGTIVIYFPDMKAGGGGRPKVVRHFSVNVQG